jgi:hypothetical protein
MGCRAKVADRALLGNPDADGKRGIGVLHDSYHQRVYGGAGVGAGCDNNPIAADTTADLSRALVEAGFLPHARVLVCWPL